MFKDRSILLLAIGQTLIWAALYYVFPALLLRWEQELGWSKPDLTAAIALAVLISGIGAPFPGRVIDAGRAPMLLATCSPVVLSGNECCEPSGNSISMDTFTLSRSLCG